MNLVGAIVILKLPQLLFQITFVPEKILAQKFSLYGTNGPLGKRMRNQHMGNGFYLIIFSNPKIDSLLVVAEQRVVIRAEIAGALLSATAN
jgi:hypothetical protein